MSPRSPRAKTETGEMRSPDFARPRRASSRGAPELGSAENPRQIPNGHSADRWRSLELGIVDALLVGTSGLLAYKLRFSWPSLQGLARLEHPFAQPLGVGGFYLGFLLLYVILLLLIAHSQKLYSVTPARSALTESLYISRAVLTATVILMVFIYLSGIKTVSRLVVGLTAVFAIVSLSLWRFFQSRLVRRRLTKGIGLQHAVIIGAGKIGVMLDEYLKRNPQLGYEVKGFLDSNHHDDPRILGKIDELSRVARQEFIDEIFITLPSEREMVKNVAVQAMQSGIGVKVVPELYDGLAWQCPLEFVGDVPVRVLHREPIPEFGLFLKRLTDIAGSFLGIFLLSPLFLAIAAAIKLDSSGPIFYRADRVGKKGRRFLCYKFRTMVPNADEIKDGLRSRNERDGPFFKISNDPRMTSVGVILRKFSLDELPQLWNVLKGDMSLVGPRPHPVDDFKSYSLEHFRRLDVTPGITCLWQLYARHDPSFEKVLALDSQYIENWSYLLDLRILLRTLPAVLKGTGS